MARLKEYPDPEQAYRDMAATQLNGRMLKPEEVAAAALYLAADESAMVTGSAMILDGGWSAGK
jgi:NAD(P)-dependent dehydrogenase (short-subunit alcohol dehydrogenase family)